MPEEGQQEEQQATGLTNADGSLAENWMNHESLDETIRGHESLKTVTDLPNAFKQLVTANQTLGKDKVVLPGPNATDEERGAFWDAVGRPKTAGDYKVEVADELKEIFTPERMAKAQEIAHKLGATKEQFEAYMNHEIETATQMLSGQQDAQQAQWDADEKEIRERLGAAREERVHVANRLIAEICKGDEGKERQLALLKKFSHDPDFIEFASDCGAKLVAHKALVAELKQDTPAEGKKKMDELRATPGYITADPETGRLLKDTDPARHKRITEEITTLVQETYADARPERTGTW